MKKRGLLRLVSMMMAIMICAQLSIPVCAAEADNNLGTYETDDGLVVEEHVDPGLVEDLPNSMRDRLLSEDCILVSVSSYYVDVEDNVQTRAAIPTSDLKLTISVSRLTAEQMNMYNVSGDAFLFMGTAEWLTNPLWELVDTFAMAWSDEFTLFKDIGYIKIGDLGNGADLVSSEYMTLSTVSSEIGFAYDVDLRIGESDDEITIAGWVYKNDSTGTANVTITYGHVKIFPTDVGVGFGVDLNGVPSINLTVGFGKVMQMSSPAYAAFNY